MRRCGDIMRTMNKTHAARTGNIVTYCCNGEIWILRWFVGHAGRREGSSVRLRSAGRVQKRTELSRNYHPSKIKEASTRRGARRLQTHLGCVCSTESPHAKDSGGVPKSRRAAVGKELSQPQDKFSEEGSFELISPKVVPVQCGNLKLSALQ